LLPLFLYAPEHARNHVRERLVVEQRRERRGDAVLQRERGELVDARDRELGVEELVHDLQDLAVLREHAAERVELGGVAPAARHWAQALVHVDERGAEADATALERLVEHAAHRGDLVGGGDALIRGIAHHEHADHAVADERRDVDAEPLFGEGLRPRREALAPGPVDADAEVFRRHLLDLAEHADERVALAGAQRRERERAVARHDRRDAVLDGRLRVRIPAELRVEVRVRVDETGGADAAARIERARARRPAVADRGDLAARDRDVAL
jgi:hypothetical protein